MLKTKPIFRDVNMEKPVSECEKCGGEIYSGGIRFFWGGKFLCTDCFRYSVRKILWDNPEQVAQEMGLEVERYE